MTLPRYDVAAGTALVTGAAGGIGSCLARELAGRGSYFALADRDSGALAATAARIRSDHPDLRVSEHVVDLADLEQVERLAQEVRAAHGPTTLLVNNAGVAMGGRFEELDPVDIDWVLAVNFRAPVHLTHLLLPDLLATPGSHVVNVSSLFGLIAPAGQTAYAASKFALRGFSESLRAELAGRVGVTTVHPGGIRTGIARNARVGARVDPAGASADGEAFDKLLTFPADKAARMILAAIERRRPRLLIGASATIPDVLARVSPAHHDRLLTAVLGRRRAQRGGSAAQAGTADEVAPELTSEGAGDAPGPDQRFVDAAGTRVRVRVNGDPASGLPPALLVHGIGRSLEDWTDQHRLLGTGRQVVSLDLPGFGLTAPLPGAAGLAAFADTAVAVLDALGIDEPVELVGNSLGGAVCLHVLVAHPERVRTLTLVDSAGFGAEVTLALRLLAVPGLGARLLSRPTPASVRRAERSLYVDAALVTADRLDHALRVAGNPGRVETYLAIAREVGSFRGVRPQWRRAVLDAIAKHPRPTLVVWGDRDLVLPIKHLQEAIRELPHARSHVFERAGHLPQVERPEEFAALVEDFWAHAAPIESVPPGRELARDASRV
ncbi:SDR family NAD(P)-dependent oxidoreductase [Agilicoccus flavus]|uniref:SDR family NAD(P)-dependent oxidoreductase n=1 Tax=Agilicoccus flavus TaxID=2775968 RepID=UPI001CF7079C|nr:SDR family NAD(P)-dependent oxidoreductase [Agilicoccus flavus]